MRRLLFAALVASALLPGAGAAEELRSALVRSFPVEKVGLDCTGGIQIDDGSFEDGYGFPGIVGLGEMAQQIPLGRERSRITAICIQFDKVALSIFNNADLFLNAQVHVWADAGGQPGEVLFSAPVVVFLPGVIDAEFVRVEVPGGLEVEGDVFLGASWSPPLENAAFFIAADDNGPAKGVAFRRWDRTTWRRMGEADVFPDYKALAIRVEAIEAEDPDPPAGPWLAASGLPGFRFKAQITAGSNTRPATQVTDCVPETLCLAGAIPDRAEVFVRIIGPRSNGFLWSQVVRFTVSQVEVWVEQLVTGEIQYYKLSAVPTDSTELPGLVDREGFRP